MELMMKCLVILVYFFFYDTAPTEIYTLSLHDALPIWGKEQSLRALAAALAGPAPFFLRGKARNSLRWTAWKTRWMKQPPLSAPKAAPSPPSRIREIGRAHV